MAGQRGDGRHPTDERAQGRLHVAHQERRGQSLSRHIGDAQQKTRLARGAGHRQHVVVVAAAPARGAIARGQVVAGRLGQLRRKQVGLDARGQLHLALELRARDLRGLVQGQELLALRAGLDRALEEPRVLDGGGGLQGQRGQELQLGRGVRHGDGAAHAP